MAAPNPASPSEAPSASFTLSDRIAEGATVHNAVVKNVLSGDSLLILADSQQVRGSPPVDKVITLASSKAPMVGRGDTKERAATKDEPFAWSSREFLRKLVIGQRIRFISEFTNPKTGREYCSVYFGDQHLGVLMAAEGFITVIAPTGKRDPRPDQAEMLRVSKIAEESKKGMFNPQGVAKAVRDVKYQFSTLGFFEKNRKAPVPAVIDQVRNGSTLRVVVQNTFEYLTVRLAGVQAPFAFPGQEEPPFSKESKAIIEQVLLGRDVELHLGCLDKADGVVFARVLCGGRDPAELLLQTGLGRFLEWNAPRDCVEKYKALEDKARHDKLRIWALASNQSLPEEKKEKGVINGTVAEVLNGCGLTVVEDLPKGKKTHTINLASLIVPRAVPNGDDEPWSWEAKDFLRNRLIGKQVKVEFEYTRAPTETLPEKSFFTVFYGNTNISMWLLERGYAKLMRHREGDARSSSYSSLLNIEQKAVAKKKGVHGPDSQAPKHPVSDLSRNSSHKKAAQFLPFLQKSDKTTAVVEYVFGGDRVKLYCAKATCFINFTLTGIRCPRVKKGEEDEPYGAEVAAYAKFHLLQRSVEVQTLSVDRGGSFIGKLFFDGKDWGLHMVEEGMASLHHPSASRLPNGQAYLEAEEKAKAQKLRIWSNWTPEQEIQPQEEKTDTSEWVELKVTEVLDGGSLYVQLSSTVPKLEELTKEINGNVPPPSNFKPAVGESVLCQYEGEWYRAKVTGVSKNQSEFEVFFTDYGNTDFVPLKALRKCDVSFLKMDPFATLAQLAYVVPPSLSEEFGHEAAIFLRDLVWDRTLVASIESQDSEKMSVVLGIPEKSILVNGSLVRAGFARVPRSRSRKGEAVLTKLKTAEERARKEHLNIWQYGDIPDPDLDEPEIPGLSAKIRK